MHPGTTPFPPATFPPLRLLDPQLANSYPSAILARDRALVLNLEYIKCIITMDMVYVTGLTSPLTLQFVHGMQQRLAAREAGAEAGGPHSARQAFGGDLKDGGVAAPSHLLLGGGREGGGGAAQQEGTSVGC